MKNETPTVVKVDTLMCADYNVPIDSKGICPKCGIAHDMQSTYILKAGNPIPAAPRRILIVENDADTSTALAHAFKMRGFEVVEERDGHMGFEVYRECFPFEFVLSDFNFIPGKRKSSCGSVIRNGADLVREIRKLIPTQRMAIMTGRTTQAKNAMDASVQDVPILRKPFRMKQLEEFLKKA